LYFQRKITGSALMCWKYSVDVLEVQVDAIDQFLLAGDADTPEHASRHFAEHGFHDVQPGTVFWREDELKSVRVKTEPALCLFGNVCRVVVEQEANPRLRRIAVVQFAQQSDEVHAGVAVADDLRDAACVEIKARQ
jgi:hypothetical protein